LSFIKGGDFFDRLNDNQLLKDSIEEVREFIKTATALRLRPYIAHYISGAENFFSANEKKTERIYGNTSRQISIFKLA
jgi:intein/homing endonuclease